MKKLQILLVEDEAIVAMKAKNSLEFLGHQVVAVASSGEEAIRQFEHHPLIDLVLMDIKIEGSIDGIEVAVKMAESRMTPIIFLTAYADDQTLQRAKLMNTAGYIVKPFDEDELRVAIEMGYYQFGLLKKEDSHNNVIPAARPASDSQAHQTNGFNNKNDDRLVVWQQNTMHLIESADIQYIEVKSGRIEIHTESQVISTRGTLNGWYDKLKKDGFYRSHRSFLVNLSKIKKIAVWMNHAYVIELKDVSDFVPLSRYRVAQLRKLLLNK